jgi:acyl-CoA thioester hydrolase
VTFDQVVFSEGRCVASAISVGVLIDDATRRPTSLTAEVVEKLKPWLRRGVEVMPPGI